MIHTSSKQASKQASNNSLKKVCHPRMFLSGVQTLFLLITLLFPSITHADITTGLVGWWKMDEGTGTSTTADSSGHGHTATLVNTPTWTAGNRQPYALNFTAASTQYCTVANMSSAVVNSNMTISGWAIFANNGSYYRTMFSLNNPGAGSGLIVSQLYSGSGNQTLQFEYAAPSQSIINFSALIPSLTNGAWQHIAATYDGSTLRGYVNGQLVGSASGTGYITSSTLTFFMGGNQSLNFPFNGPIDDIRMYNRALSAQDVMTLYIGGMKIGSGGGKSVLNGFHTSY